ncbi:MAG: hypothetical protein HY043_02565 [Verrucomicrobia bacterium]|nr:hypothetical protein [Verrucomicrobiota bacterium]
MTTELIVAMAILATVLLPIGYAFSHERVLCRAYYHRAIAMEIVDGELEVLAAGEWRAFKSGIQPYVVRAESSKNLPPGKFELTLSNQLVRLEWLPAGKNGGGHVRREANLR